jgi:hypothetical protein
MQAMQGRFLFAIASRKKKSKYSLPFDSFKSAMQREDAKQYTLKDHNFD